MEKINSLDAVSSRYIPANTVGKSAVDAKAVASVQENNATATNNESTQVSALARQLSDAAVRAAARDAGTDRDGLGEIARSVTEKLLGASYDMNKVAHDAEVPKTEDPDLLARAKQATSFVNGDGANPFRGMSREQLALITYDESGDFTVNERRAAWLESYDQEQQWKRAAIAKMDEEYNRTGQVSSGTLSEILKHYKSLPAIEEAQLPKGYDAQLLSQIQASESGGLPQSVKDLQVFLDRMTES
ncbi:MULTISPECIES: hypothetical protein [Pectobacterium]|uniref:Uncharacterized protein n=1 Tax=Pectobacterium punjabense TaxID=2108399 RepID=A0ABX6L7W8_9GAMM|nr:MULTISPECIES: hypothetical protein [Pectobacterium]GKW13653.1 hypothetical protein PEC301899_39350 [Pectobacterium carotovorum subsp. carotovorum]MBS4433357.1 hypothetical protein [Pectobacterium punjabense]MCE9731377.1 hypothetical protein [Pectobacterium sp. IFB5596]MCL6324640.1 hypothetical protein [Pectobacterium polaris]MDE8744038.1 hypothetical protein [Pectobacterium polaris]